MNYVDKKTIEDRVQKKRDLLVEALCKRGMSDMFEEIETKSNAGFKAFVFKRVERMGKSNAVLMITIDSGYFSRVNITFDIPYAFKRRERVLELINQLNQIYFGYKFAINVDEIEAIFAYPSSISNPEEFNADLFIELMWDFAQTIRYKEYDNIMSIM